MNLRTSLLMLALFSCWPAPMTLVAAPPEEKYFETRDNFIRQFEKVSTPLESIAEQDQHALDEKDEHALAELEKQLKAIVGPVNVEGFPEEGKINLETLQKGDLGFGQVDGLRFSANEEYLFVTTDNLLKKYLAGQPNLPKDLAELSRTGEFYAYAFTSGEAVMYFAGIPVKSPNEKSYVRAFLALTAQVLAPSFQKTSLSSLRREIEYSGSSRQRQLRSQKFRSVETSGTGFRKKADASGLNNEKAFNESVQYEQQGFEAYQRCYDREVRNQKFFASLKKQAQSIVDRLLRN